MALIHEKRKIYKEHSVSFSYVYFKFVMIFRKNSVTGAMPFHMLKF